MAEDKYKFLHEDELDGTEQVLPPMTLDEYLAWIEKNAQPFRDDPNG